MAQLSFPYTAVEGDRTVTAEMQRESYKSLGLNGWGSGLTTTRNSPTGAVFTVGVGTAWLDGVSYLNTAPLTVTGSSAVGTHGIILRFGVDRDAEIVWVQDYLNNPPSYDHILLYHDIQSASYSLVDKRALSTVEAIHNRPDAVTAYHIAAGAVGSSEIATDAVGTAEIAASAVGTSEIANNAVTLAKMADNSVGTAELVNSSVTSQKLLGEYKVVNFDEVPAEDLFDVKVGYCTLSVPTKTSTEWKSASRGLGSLNIVVAACATNVGTTGATTAVYSRVDYTTGGSSNTLTAFARRSEAGDSNTYTPVDVIFLYRD